MPEGGEQDAQLLGYVGPPARSAAEALSRALQSSDSIMRQSAEDALKKILG